MRTMKERLARDFEEGMNRHMTDRYRSYLLGKVQGFRLEIGELA